MRDEFKEAWKKNGVFRPINERLLQVRGKIGGLGISLIAVYAPTEVDESENSENFYETLQSTIESICKKDVIIVAGDFNARVGQPTSRSSLHGKHNPDVRNNNGRRLVDFATITTWQSPRLCSLIRRYISIHGTILVRKMVDMFLTTYSSMLNTDPACWTPKCSEKLFIFLITSLLLQNANSSNHYVISNVFATIVTSNTLKIPENSTKT